jgi:hypothetical protein
MSRYSRPRSDDSNNNKTKNQFVDHSYSQSSRIKNNNIDNVIDREDTLRFRLQTQEEEFIFKPDERQFSFYQICQFSVNKKYKVRKIIYNETAEMITHREKAMTKDILDKFLKKCPEFKYTIYPVYDLDVVGFPDPNEILTAKSNILNEY